MHHALEIVYICATARYIDMTSSVRSGDIGNYASVDARIWAAQRLELDNSERLEFDKALATSNDRL